MIGDYEDDDTWDEGPVVVEPSPEPAPARKVITIPRGGIVNRSLIGVGLLALMVGAGGVHVLQGPPRTVAGPAVTSTVTETDTATETAAGAVVTATPAPVVVAGPAVTSLVTVVRVGTVTRRVVPPARTVTATTRVAVPTTVTATRTLPRATARVTVRVTATRTLPRATVTRVITVRRTGR